MSPTFAARIDDLVAEESYAFAEPLHTLVARRPEEVASVLVAVEQATSEGLWAVGFVAYEAAPGLDAKLSVHAPSPGDAFSELPLAWFGLFRQRQAVALLEHGPLGTYHVDPWQPDTDRCRYSEKVEAIRAHIADGDTYQCNLTIRLASKVSGEVFDLYRDLALAQHGAYNAYIDTGRYVVASASPELFFSWQDNKLTTRPMKGTAVRGRYGAEDDARALALSTSQKDLAENLMIVDLLRNDVGKLATYGGVDVPSLFTLERFDTVWQLTSTVTAQLHAEATLAEIFASLFPCGSVTGAPKARTMALINELEDSARNVYCGAVGVVAPPGEAVRARFNVAIRTVVVDRATNEARYGTGGGVIWDSVAASEHAELMAKAAILQHRREAFSLLETMAFVPGSGIRNEARHLERLSASAAYFAFRLDSEEVRATLRRAVAGCNDERRVRLLLDRRGGIAVELDEMPPISADPVRLGLDTTPIDSSDVLRFHKTTVRAFYSERAAARPDVDDVILVNESGEITESTVANLAVRLGEAWCTPPLDAGLLPGVERARLLDEGVLVERRIAVTDLCAESELALVSSLRGWRPAVLIENAVLRPRAEGLS